MLSKASFILVVLGCYLGLVYCCVPPDCDRLDCGTCGNACCTYEYYFNVSTSDLNLKISSDLKEGGSDQRYWLVSSKDLRQYNISAHFIIQGIHTTLKRQYNDTLNFVIKPVTTINGFSKLTAFSISQIDGAYCDQGQNYKNIVTVVKNLGEKYIESHVSGCDTINP